MATTYLNFVSFNRTLFSQDVNIDERSVTNSPTLVQTGVTITTTNTGRLISRELPKSSIGTNIRLFKP